ncbi:MAG: hypothetical protein ABJH45_02530 [Paracoccaceae bacterium]
MTGAKIGFDILGGMSAVRKAAKTEQKHYRILSKDMAQGVF